MMRRVAVLMGVLVLCLAAAVCFAQNAPAQAKGAPPGDFQWKVVGVEPATEERGVVVNMTAEIPQGSALAIQTGYFYLVDTTGQQPWVPAVAILYNNGKWRISGNSNMTLQAGQQTIGIEFKTNQVLPTQQVWTVRSIPLPKG